MPYLHRIDTEEQRSAVIAPVETDAGLQMIFGLAPVNMVDDPKVNEPVLVRSYAEAVAAFGFCYDFDNYTIAEAIDANFNLFQNAPIIFVNVLDPATHKTALSEVTVSTASGVAKLEQVGVLKSGLVVKNGNATLTEGTDYTVGFSVEGYLEVTLADATIASVKISGFKLDPSAVTKNDIIGGYTAATGARKGLEVISNIYQTLGVFPGIVLAPKWSNDAEVAAAMAAKVASIDGRAEAMCVIDINTATYATYTAAAGAREAMGVVSRDAVLVWLKGKVGTKVYNGSTIWAAATVATDAANDNVPMRSPSNVAANIAAAVLSNGTEVRLNNTEAAVLNGAGIVTFIYDDGWKVWGNNTAAYPGTTVPEDRWIACRRMMNWYRNHFMATYKEKVDDPTSYKQTRAVVDAENQYLNSLASADKIAGGEVVFREEDNPINQILDGQVRFYTRIAFWTPSEHITNVIEFDPSFIQNALFGG